MRKFTLSSVTISEVEYDIATRSLSGTADLAGTQFGASQWHGY